MFVHLCVQLFESYATQQTAAEQSGKPLDEENTEKTESHEDDEDEAETMTAGASEERSRTTKRIILCDGNGITVEDVDDGAAQGDGTYIYRLRQEEKAGELE